MRIALLADIHGNMTALDAVLNVLESEPIDQIVCLGDVAIFGPQPRETLACLRSLACPVVMGNTDAWALAPKIHPLRNEDSSKFNDIEFWGALQLSGEDRAFIHTFQATVTVDLGGGERLLCYHGSPRSFDDEIVATTPEETLHEMLAGQQALVMAGGHTHSQLLRRFQTSLLLNPGSVGLPFEVMAEPAGDRNPPWAEFAIVEWQAGRLRVELRRVPLDMDHLAQQVLNSGMPHADWWLAGWG
jgi:predicted phosphodiesterase